MQEIKKIYLVRHCEPQFPNGVPVCIGRTDLPLSLKGVEQAEKLKDYFSKLNIYRIYSSPLTRALKTAEIIADNMLNVEIKIDFSEFDIGKWDGMSFAEIKEKYPQEYKQRGENLEYYVVEGGESMAACRERALMGLLRAIEETGGNIIIVAHAGVNRTVLSAILGISIGESFAFRHDYGSVNVLLYDGDKLTASKIGVAIDELMNQVEEA